MVIMEYMLMIREISFSNSAVLSAAVVASVVFISFGLKIYDYSDVTTWLQKRTNLASTKLVSRLFFIWMVVELCVALGVIIEGSVDESTSLISAIFLLITSISSLLMLDEAGGCPCFGSVSITSRFSNLKICGSAVFLVLALFIYAPLSQLRIVFCSILAMLLSGLFLLGRSFGMKHFSGVKCNHDLFSALAGYDINIHGDETTVLIFFLKKKCKSCMVLMRYVEKISCVFLDKIRFVLIIDGFDIDEVAKFGGAYVIPGKGGEMRSKADVNSFPALIAIHGDNQKKYVGLNACNTGISTAICGFLSK
jgi:hypothetical protein